MHLSAQVVSVGLMWLCIHENYFRSFRLTSFYVINTNQKDNWNMLFRFHVYFVDTTFILLKCGV